MQPIRFLAMLLGLLVALASSGCDRAPKKELPEYSQRNMREQFTREYLPANYEKGESSGSDDKKKASPTGSNDADVQEEVASTAPHLVAKSPATDVDAEKPEQTPKIENRYKGLLAGLTVFVLAIFVGFEVITKVPPTLHTPLMSGSNAISGITLVGAVTVTGLGTTFSFSVFTGFIAIVLATINVVGGFFVTHRMLSMFKRR